MLRGIVPHLGTAHHGAVRIHELAQHRHGRTARQPGQIDGRLGMPPTFQHPARTRHERKHMPRAHQPPGIARLHPGQRGPDGRETVRGAHAGRHARGRLHRHRERRALAAAIARHHGRQPQQIGIGLGHAHTDNAAAVADHLRHLRHGHVLGHGDEIDFVLALGIVMHQHHRLLPQGLQPGLHALAHPRREGRHSSTGTECRQGGKGRIKGSGHVKAPSWEIQEKRFQGVKPPPVPRARAAQTCRRCTPTMRSPAALAGQPEPGQMQGPHRHGGHGVPARQLATAVQGWSWSSFIRTVTVGRGFAPRLLTSGPPHVSMRGTPERSRARAG